MLGKPKVPIEMLTVHQFACLSDNYGFLARDAATGKTAAIDTPDADAILRELKGQGWSLDLILNTHWHADHAGGAHEMVDRTASPGVEIHEADAAERGKQMRFLANRGFGGDAIQKVVSGGHRMDAAPDDGLRLDADCPRAGQTPRGATDAGGSAGAGLQ